MKGSAYEAGLGSGIEGDRQQVMAALTTGGPAAPKAATSAKDTCGCGQRGAKLRMQGSACKAG